MRKIAQGVLGTFADMNAVSAVLCGDVRIEAENWKLSAEYFSCET